MRIARFLVLSAFVSFLLPFSSRAEGIQAFHETYPLDDDLSQVSAAFEVNRDQPELGRAWIHIRLSGYQNNGEDYPEQQEINKNVPGLTYDSASGEVRFQASSGKPIVCAKLEEKGFLFLSWERMRSTGHCSLLTTIVKIPKDDGLRKTESRAAEVALLIDAAEHPSPLTREARVPAGIARP